MLIYTTCKTVLLNSSVTMTKIRLIILYSIDLHNKIYCYSTYWKPVHFNGKKTRHKNGQNILLHSHSLLKNMPQ